jgi:hypothetical protein
MAYLHCHGKLENGEDCGWSQDDFWTEGGYNPVSFLQKDRDLEKNLFRDKMYFDEWMLKDMGIEYGKDEKGFYCSGRQYVTWELRRKANNIEKMFITTEAQWKQVRDVAVCPNCGQRNWDID